MINERPESLWWRGRELKLEPRVRGGSDRDAWSWKNAEHWASDDSEVAAVLELPGPEWLARWAIGAHYCFGQGATPEAAMAACDKASQALAAKIVRGIASERRVPVQATYTDGVCTRDPGTVSGEEHDRAWAAFAVISEHYGFSYAEITAFLGHEPKTWRPL